MTSRDDDLASLRAKVCELEARLERLTLRVLYGAKGEADRPSWRPEWSPPKDARPRCGAPMPRGPCCVMRVVRPIWS